MSRLAVLALLAVAACAHPERYVPPRVTRIRAAASSPTHPSGAAEPGSSTPNESGVPETTSPPRSASRPGSEAGICIASWYGAREGARPGTVAHKTLPFGTRLRITYAGRHVTATVADRGPYVVGRCLDAATDVFSQLAPLSRGVIQVAYEKVA